MCSPVSSACSESKSRSCGDVILVVRMSGGDEEKKKPSGRYSLAAESMYDRPFQWGSKRTGPDLARVGAGDDDDGVALADEDPPGGAAVPAFGHRRLHDPQRLAAVVREGVRVRVALGAHEAVQVLGRPGPVDAAVLQGAFVEEAGPGPVLWRPHRRARGDQVERLAHDRRDQGDGRAEQVRGRPGAPGSVGEAHFGAVQSGGGE